VLFFHDYVSKDKPKLSKHKKEYKQIISERDLKVSELIRNSSIESEYKAIIKNSELKLTAYHKKKKELLKEYSYLGYTSFKNFLLGVGFPISGFILSFILLYHIVKSDYQVNRKKFWLIISYLFIVSWGYWLSWSLLSFSLDPNRPFDFPKFYYNLALFILPTVAYLSAYWLFKYNNNIEERLKQIIRGLFSFMYTEVDEKKYIKESLKKDYIKRRVELVNDAVGNE
jgi:hypothetical protein